MFTIRTILSRSLVDVTLENENVSYYASFPRIRGSNFPFPDILLDNRGAPCYCTLECRSVNTRISFSQVRAIYSLRSATHFQFLVDGATRSITQVGKNICSLNLFRFNIEEESSKVSIGLKMRCVIVSRLYLLRSIP